MIQKIQTSETKFLWRINRILEIIKKHGPINRFVVCRMLNITPKQYELLHPYLAEGYGDKIEYNRTTREWTWLKPIEKPIAEDEEPENDPEQEGIKDDPNEEGIVEEKSKKRHKSS